MQALFEWARQFLAKDKDLLAIGDINLAIHNQGYYRNAVALSDSKDKLNEWLLTIVKSRISQIKLAICPYRETDVDELKLTPELNLSLIFLDVPDPLASILEGMYGLLADSRFPPLLIQTKFPLEVLRHIGYIIHPVGGCSNVYLASDHPIYNKLRQIKSQPKSNIPTILAKWKDQDTADFTWSDWLSLIQHLRLHGQHQECYECIQAVKSTGEIPQNEAHLLDFELGTIAFYLNEIELGYSACERVILSSTSANVINMAIKNQGYYVKPLPTIQMVDLSRTHGAYKSSSPSIIQTETGYLVNLRHVNYSITANGSYIMRDPANIVRTTNYLIKLDEDLQEISAEIELLDVNPELRYPSRIMGLEDVRLFSETHFLCTCVDVNPQGIPQLCLGQYASNGWVTKLTLLQIGEKLQVEKNWTPVRVLANKLRFIYRYIPLQVYDLDLETGQCKLFLEREHENVTSGLGLRGSTGLIQYKGGYLGIVHHVYYDNYRNYFHRFVWLSEDFGVMKYSRTWVFEKQHDIEYTLGMAHNKQGVVITYSVQDNSSKLILVDYAVVDKMLGL